MMAVGKKTSAGVEKQQDVPSLLLKQSKVTAWPEELWKGRNIVEYVVEPNYVICGV